jgi:hypothetical protein
MAVWNRRHRGHGIKLIVALLLIAISISFVFTTIGMNASSSVVEHATGTPRHNGITATATTPAATSGEVVSIKTVTPTAVLKKKQLTQPCVAKTVKWSVGPASGVSSGKRHKTKPTTEAPTAPPQPSPPLAIVPTDEPTTTPTDVPVEPTETDEDTPTPEPTETIIPVISPTPVATLPPERTVIALITPTLAAIETSTPAAINGDGTATPAPDLGNEKASLASRVIHEPVEQPEVVAQVKSHANCLSNSVGGPVDGVQSLAVNLAFVLGSVLPGVLLFYGALCAVYMLRQRSERKKRQKIKW